MNTAKKISSVTLASAAAALLFTGCSSPTPKVATDTGVKAKKAVMAQVECTGINSCKGTSECATATSGCKGQNSCKGKGWVKASKAECLSKGGKLGNTIKM